MGKRNNRGFSIIELVVTLAVMAIITVVSIMILSWIHSAKVKSAASTINSSIGELRSLTLSRSNEWKMTIEKDKVTIYTGVIKPGTSEVDWHSYKTHNITNGVDIFCKDATSNKVTLGSGYPNIEIRFKKSDGTFDVNVCNRSASDNFKITDIYINKANYDRVVHLVELTGKHSINK